MFADDPFAGEEVLTTTELQAARGGFKAGGFEFSIGVTVGPVLAQGSPFASGGVFGDKGGPLGSGGVFGGKDVFGNPTNSAGGSAETAAAPGLTTGSAASSSSPATNSAQANPTVQSSQTPSVTPVSLTQLLGGAVQQIKKEAGVTNGAGGTMSTTLNNVNYTTTTTTTTTSATKPSAPTTPTPSANAAPTGSSSNQFANTTPTTVTAGTQSSQETSIDQPGTTVPTGTQLIAQGAGSGSSGVSEIVKPNDTTVVYNNTRNNVIFSQTTVVDVVLHNYRDAARAASTIGLTQNAIANALIVRNLTAF